MSAPFSCSRALFLSLSPVSSYQFRRNELASPDSPNSSSGSIVSPGCDSITTPSLHDLSNLVSYHDTYHPSELDQTNTTKHKSELQIQVNNLTLNDNRNQVLWSQTSGVSSSHVASYVPLSSLSKDSPFKPLTSRPNEHWKDTRQIHSEREDTRIHKPVPFLPVLAQYPQDFSMLEQYHKRNNNDNSFNNSCNTVSDNTDTTTRPNNRKEAKEFKLPALVPTQSQLSPVSVVIITIIYFEI